MTGNQGPTAARRLSRRRVLIAATGVAAAAAAGVAGIALSRGGGGETSAPARSPTAPASPSRASPSRASPTPDTRIRGGVARLPAATTFAFDTFDTLRAGEPSVAEVLGRTHSRLVSWTDLAAAALGGDLAESWEQPDATTLVFHLRPGVRWQDRPPLDGRPFTVDDAVAHFRRMLTVAASVRLPSTQRAPEFAAIRRVAAPASDTVRFDLDRPDPLLLGALAARFALVQAPEAVSAFESAWHEARPGQVIGTGPFVYEGDRAGALAFSTHAGGARPPLLDGLLVSPPARATVETFLAHNVDEVITRDRREAAALRSAAPEALELPRFEDSAVISTVFTGAPPWNNPELWRAISAALNRSVLADRLFGGRAAACAPIAPLFEAFALPESELTGFPGYRSDPDADAADARARWTAGGGRGLGPVTIDIPSIFDPRYSAGATVVARLNEVLDTGQFRPAIENYPTISAKAAALRYGNGVAALWFGWGPPFAGPDPSRYLLDTFGTGGSGTATLGEAPDRVRRPLASLATELDPARRRELAREAARGLLAAGGAGVFDWLLQRSEVFRWPYSNGPRPSPLGDEHLDVARWLDPTGGGSSLRHE